MNQQNYIIINETTYNNNYPFFSYILCQVLVFIETINILETIKHIF